jgi:hypothetical protein
MSFDPCNCPLKIWRSIRSTIPKVGVHLGVWWFIPSHFPTLPGGWNVTPGLHFLPTPLLAFTLVASPRLGLRHRQCKRSTWGISRNHSIFGWHEVSSWSHKVGANMNYAQESKLLDNRGPYLFPKRGWCFVTNHWRGRNLTSFVWISWWVLWRPFCRTNHSKNIFANRLLLAHLAFSKMPKIIIGVMMYVKLMHKFLLWMAFYTLYHLWDLLKNGELI